MSTLFDNLPEKKPEPIARVIPLRPDLEKRVTVIMDGEDRYWVTRVRGGYARGSLLFSGDELDELIVEAKAKRGTK